LFAMSVSLLLHREAENGGEKVNGPKAA
jgi:hypothetical protein